MEKSEKHLEMIQAVVARLASNCFAYKGWTVTVAAGIVAFLIQSNKALIYVAIYPVMAFWFLDGHSLALERSFRKLYDAARKGEIGEYSLDITKYRRPLFDQMRCMLSVALILFYGITLSFVILMSKATAK